MGMLFYRSKVNLLTGWIHHSVYVFIVEYAIQRGWSYIFSLCAVMEVAVPPLPLEQSFSNAIFYTDSDVCIGLGKHHPTSSFRRHLCCLLFRHAHPSPHPSRPHPCSPATRGHRWIVWPGYHHGLHIASPCPLVHRMHQGSPQESQGCSATRPDCQAPCEHCLPTRHVPVCVSVLCF